MAAGARLSVTDMRRSARHPVDHTVTGEHLGHGELPLRIVNLSAHGFMIDDSPEITRGDRVIVPLPAIGRIEAYCMWRTDSRAGFQFERVIRPDDFNNLISVLQPNPRLRRKG
ncbi:PilZ domain-containing protein [Altericroceibacterium endophyticum]|uniref:PilZ domain-containing protein n=1 Tax=Altericroceibacterium endophyticum TaxID=1808508 RepID=A0A6I4T040_9SPHN|nr:PilZ domain-containing protein [Altericroceibacterium endophyticum]MXO64444.1 PilZ domain-containing protein [Altericroceibacterium endophyticum]